MADNTIDSLVLEISANSKGAEASLNKLTDSLAKLQRRLGGFKGFDNVCAGMERLGKASRTLNPEKLNGYSSALGSFAEAASKLSAMKSTDVNRAVKSLEKLGNINLDGIARQINALKGVDTAALNHLGTAFQSFTASLAGSEKVSAGTSKLFTSLSQMSVSADNMAIVQSSLPGLSEEIRKFIDTMAAAPAVSAGTVSLVTALSGMASAGNKIQKTVSSLPGLTAGIQSFIQSLSGAPKLNNNVVRAVESLSKIAPAGAKAGSAARNLQKNIQSLSGSMAGLEKNSRRGLLGIKNFGGQILSLAGLAGGIYGLITGIKNAINYSSDLAEAQNVVEQGFGSLSYMADDFASNSVQAFGMSALSAKKMSGQFAAMGRSLGVVPERAAEMSLSLTGLAGDLASFWNVSHDVAQTALESVFTGETESLKKFAVVMTQANLQQFAYSKGINKSVSAMTQAEQAQLRYAYVMEATAAAHGDFSRTSNEWAGQTRILAGQFQNLAGIIGGGLKAAFLPVITVINALMAKIISLANLISSFIGKLFGVKPQAASAGAGLSEMAESAGSLGNNIDAAAGGIGGHMYASSVSKGGNFANNVIGSVATGSISQMGSISGEKAAEALHSYMGYAALESGAENVPTFQNVEIGGGRITGTEVTAEHPEGISFGMYHADQYVAPEGQYTTVHAVDGTAWYKQYAVDAVDKSPYMAPDGSIAFNESIVKKLPPAPRRKDKI